MLQLKVRTRPFIEAVATFRVLGEDDRCVIELEEVPIRTGLFRTTRIVLDPSIHVRNHRSLERLSTHLTAAPDGPRRRGASR